MTDNTELEELAFSILEQMYGEASPPLDFTDVRENPEEYPDDWYAQHTLSKQRQREIIDEHREGTDITDKEYSQLVWTTILDLGPSYPDNSEDR